MILLLALLTVADYSPADSCRALISMTEIPERALLFAEVAAREGGQALVDLALLLEVAGRFEEARVVYESAAGNVDDDPWLESWLAARALGTAPLDTLVLLRAIVANEGDGTVTDLQVEIPLPEPHPPYQELELVGGVFEVSGDVMLAPLDSVAPGEQASLPLLLRISQQPYTFRPIPRTYAGMDLDALTEFVRMVPDPETVQGSGPCLYKAIFLRDLLEYEGIEVSVVGGLLRSADGSLVFHAWNLSDANMPLDPVIFTVDSLRGIGHCPTDIIPLWDLMATGGNEISVFYPADQDAQLSIGMTATFESVDLEEEVRSFLPTFLGG